MRGMPIALAALSALSLAGCPTGDLLSARGGVLTPGVYIGTLSCGFSCAEDEEDVLSSDLATSLELTTDSHIFIDGNEYAVGVVARTSDGTTITVTDIAANPSTVVIQYRTETADGGGGNGSIILTWLSTSVVNMKRSETRLLPAIADLCTLECEGELTR